MARKGYIKLYRQVIDDDIWTDPAKFKLWTLCLMKASHKPQKVVVGNRIIELKPGQFVTGRDELASEYNRGSKKKDLVTGVSLYKWLEIFQKTKKLYIEKTTKYTVITVLNWDKYQQ